MGATAAMSKVRRIDYRRAVRVIFLVCMAVYTVGLVATGVSFAYAKLMQRDSGGPSATGNFTSQPDELNPATDTANPAPTLVPSPPSTIDDSAAQGQANDI